MGKLRGAQRELDPEITITVRVGVAGVSCDGEVLWTDGETAPITVGWVERVASVTPEQDWRIWFHTPRRSLEYQRHAGRWLRVDRRSAGGLRLVPSTRC